MISSLYRLGLLAASVGGAALAMSGAWIVSQGESLTVGRALVYGGLALACGAAGACVVDRGAQ